MTRADALHEYHETRWSERLLPDGRLTCPKCGEARSIDEFVIRGAHARPSGACRSCRAEYPSASAEASRGAKLRYRYGITDEDYERLLAEQTGVCAICGGPPAGVSKRGRFYVDHDHETDEVRGLLCAQCNLLLGAAKDSIPVLVAAIAYLDRGDR